MPAASQTIAPTAPIPISTSTPIPTPTALAKINFAVIGDYGDANQQLPAVAEMVLGWTPDFIVTLGDNNYPKGDSATIDTNIGKFFHAYIWPYSGEYGTGADTIRFFPVLGNHDWNTQKAQPYLDYFELPNNERYYDFEWGFLHFFMLDSDSREPDGIGTSSLQAKWLEEKLDTSTAPWKIVVLHHPPYSSGEREANLAVRWPFEAWGADIVFAGHEHFYERLVVNEFPYIINGLGGGPRYAFGEIHPGSQKRFRAQNGALMVQATQKNLTVQFFTITGVEIDTFELNK
ncbi:MAG: metallophosphoesterase [Chloroflexota bacterium]